MKIFFLILIAINFNLYANWQRTNGPEGGNAGTIISLNNYLFINAGVGGIYRSSDTGQTWSLLNNGLPNFPYCYQICSYDTILYSSIYQNGIFLSRDYGITWEAINKGIENLTFYGLYVDSFKIFAGNANGGVYYSSDNGITWLERNNGLNNGGSLERIFYFTKYNGDIWGGGYTLFKTSDYGLNWQSVTPSLTITNNITYMDAYDSSIYIGTYDNLYNPACLLSRTLGTSWEFAPISSFATITSIYLNKDSIYIGSSGGRVYISYNDGVSFTLKTNNLSNNFVQGIKNVGNKLFIGTSDGPFFSEDQGDSWQFTSKGYSSYITTSFQVKDSTLIVGTAGNGIFISNDKGKSWQKSNNGLNSINELYINTIEILENKIYIATENGVFKSNDLGANWVKIFTPGLNNNVSDLSVDSSNIAICVYNQGVYMSYDTGQSWSLKDTASISSLYFTSILLHGDTLLVGTINNGLFLSVDQGGAWVNKNVFNTPYIKQIKYNNNQTFVFTYNGLYLSKDWGTSWTAIHTCFNNDIINAIAFNNNIIYAVNDIGVYYSYNDGLNWYSTSGDIENLPVVDMVYSDSNVYLGTYGFGVWKGNVENIDTTFFLVGTVSDGYNKPIDSALVFLIKYDNIDSPLLFVDSTYTDTLGEYFFNNKYENVYIKVVPDSQKNTEVLTTYYYNALTFQEVSLITATNCETINYNVKLISKHNPDGPGSIGGKISEGAGKVNSCDGSAVSGLTVILMNQLDQPVTYAITDAQGSFSFNNIALGTYTMWVDYPFVDNSQAPVVIIDENTQQLTDLSFILNKTYLELCTESYINQLTGNNIWSVYPNPYTHNTNITYSLNEESAVLLEIYNTLGQKLTVLQNSTTNPGTYTQQFSSKQLGYSSGIYIVKLTIGDATYSKRLVELK